MSSSACCCVAGASAAPADPTPPRAADSPAARAPLVQRALHFLSWLLPSAILALLPKCPMCLAAYAAVWLGLGLSLPAAAQLHTLLIILCLAALAFLAAKRLPMRHLPRLAWRR